MIRLIAAVDRKRGIAKHGVMPWYIPEDEKFFTDQTKTYGGHVLSGGSTFREAYHLRPLVGRQNYILTRSPEPIAGATVINDLAKFLEEFKQDLWVSGGGEVFTQVMHVADELYLTHIDAEFGCNTFFPEYDKNFELAKQSAPREQNGFHFRYALYTKKP